MSKRCLHLIIVFLGFWHYTIGQNSHFIPCLFDVHLHQKDNAQPGYTARIFKEIEKRREVPIERFRSVLNIKVVFHVVYKEDEENISDALIEKQMDALNIHFRRQNADTINLRSIFHDVAGDPGISFELDEIKRVRTTKLFTPTLSKLPDEVKSSADGGSDAKDTEHYLNIWVCRIQPINFFGSVSPVLGYAYPPDSLSHWPDGSNAPSKNLDGVVLDYRTLLNDVYDLEPIGNIPMLGRTAVHEVGHYLGLRHISGDGGLFGASCGASDGVDDTPEQGMQSQFDCNESQNTCGQGETGDLPDMIENYMDYS